MRLCSRLLVTLFGLVLVSAVARAEPITSDNPLPEIPPVLVGGETCAEEFFPEDEGDGELEILPEDDGTLEKPFDELVEINPVYRGEPGPVGDGGGEIIYYTSAIGSGAAQAVPEPGTLVLFGASLAGFALFACRRRLTPRQP